MQHLELENQIMDEWRQAHHILRKPQPPNLEVIGYAYGNTAPKANFGKIIVAQYASEVQHRWYCEDENVTALSERPELIKELVAEMSRKMRGSSKNPFSTGKSPFQEHERRKGDVLEPSDSEDSSESSSEE